MSGFGFMVAPRVKRAVRLRRRRWRILKVDVYEKIGDEEEHAIKEA